MLLSIYYSLLWFECAEPYPVMIRVYLRAPVLVLLREIKHLLQWNIINHNACVSRIIFLLCVYVCIDHLHCHSSTILPQCTLIYTKVKTTIYCGSGGVSSSKPPSASPTDWGSYAARPSLPIPTHACFQAK